jgi:hypothetical protein
MVPNFVGCGVKLQNGVDAESARSTDIPADDQDVASGRIEADGRTEYIGLCVCCMDWRKKRKQFVRLVISVGNEQTDTVTGARDT